MRVNKNQLETDRVPRNEAFSGFCPKTGRKMSRKQKLLSKLTLFKETFNKNVQKRSRINKYQHKYQCQAKK